MEALENKYILASSGEDYMEAKKLFQQYAALIDIDLTFQKFE